MGMPLSFVHIAGGMVGLLSGMFAMAYRKVARGHRAAGSVFVIAMLVMGASAIWLAILKQQTDNIFGLPIRALTSQESWKSSDAT